MSVSDQDIQNLLDQTEDNICELTVRTLKENRSFQAFSDVMGTALGTGQKIDDMIAAMFASSSNLACKNGCFNCCMLKVVTQPSFVVISLLYARQANDGYAFELAHKALVSQQDGCQFLDNGSCSIYPVRPVACRLFHSHDFGECLKGNYQRNPRLENNGMSAAQSGLKRGLDEIGLDCSNVFFKDAVRLMMSQKNVAEDWLNGKDVFKPCYAGF